MTEFLRNTDNRRTDHESIVRTTPGLSTKLIISFVPRFASSEVARCSYNTANRVTP